MTDKAREAGEGECENLRTRIENVEGSNGIVRQMDLRILSNQGQRALNLGNGDGSAARWKFELVVCRSFGAVVSDNIEACVRLGVNHRNDGQIRLCGIDSVALSFLRRSRQICWRCLPKNSRSAWPRYISPVSLRDSP